jgi:hypothetical protein
LSRVRTRRGPFWEGEPSGGRNQITRTTLFKVLAQLKEPVEFFFYKKMTVIHFRGTLPSVLRIRDRYLLVINPGIYTLTYCFSNYSRTRLLYNRSSQQRTSQKTSSPLLVLS